MTPTERRLNQDFRRLADANLEAPAHIEQALVVAFRTRKRRRAMVRWGSLGGIAAGLVAGIVLYVTLPIAPAPAPAARVEQPSLSLPSSPVPFVRAGRVKQLTHKKRFLRTRPSSMRCPIRIPKRRWNTRPWSECSCRCMRSAISDFRLTSRTPVIGFKRMCCWARMAWRERSDLYSKNKKQGDDMNYLRSTLAVSALVTLGALAQPPGPPPHGKDVFSSRTWRRQVHG